MLGNSSGIGTLDYNERLDKEGQIIYENLIQKLKQLKVDFTNYTKDAKEIENQHAPFLYGGVYEGILTAVENLLNSITDNLESTNNLITQGRDIVHKINNMELNKSIGLFMLKTLDGATSRNHTVGTAVEGNINYANIYEEGFTPQGITIIGNQVFITAYAHDKNSKIYVYDTTDSTKNYSIVLENNSHVGGITFDEKNQVFLVTGSKGSVNAYDLDALNRAVKEAKQGTYNTQERSEIVINLNTAKHSIIKLNSNINMNFEQMNTGNTTTGYNSGSVYFDNETGEVYIAKFAKDGKLISGKVTYDKATGTYDMINSKKVSLDDGVQGISTYHKDNKTYLVESRSYGGNKTQITVNDITNGIDKSELVGSKQLSNRYGEGIQVDKSGNATIVFEQGAYGKYEETETININEIIDDQNGKYKEIKINSDKYEKGEEVQSEAGYSIYN